MPKARCTRSVCVFKERGLHEPYHLSFREGGLEKVYDPSNAFTILDNLVWPLATP